MSPFVYGNTSFKNKKWLEVLIFCFKGRGGREKFNGISNTCSISAHSLKEMQFSKMSVVGKASQNNKLLTSDLPKPCKGAMAINIIVVLVGM